ncbi:hypothetical protein [Escherichia coli]|uniref:hypothetical protein n=1 Tax=Escherichia coli TaxID=562 RepID=UPI0035A4F4A5
MTNKQELRENFEQWWEINYHNGNPPRFGWEHWRDGDGYQIDDDESELDGMWEAWQAAHSSRLEALEKRIAELEAREVTLPQVLDVHPLGPQSAKMFWAFKRDVVNECADRIRAAGISINGEG